MPWFWWWMVFVLFLLVVPLGYGWGYRGWGAPYPTSVNRRRARLGARATDPAVDRVVDPDGAVLDDPVAAEAAGWGVVADVLWVIAVGALVWLVLALLL